MYYPDAPCCVMGNAETKHYAEKNDKKQMLQTISELDFSLTDLNLYLDTHPSDKEALELFKKLAATLNSYVFDYEKSFGPLCARANTDTRYFMWVSDDIKWPWQRECE